MRGLWAVGLAALALLAGMGWWLAPLHPDIVALQLAFTPRAFGEVIHQWGPQNLARYRAHFAADYAFLVLYGLFGWLLVRRGAVFAAVSPRARAFAAAALPVAALFDAIENALHLWLTAEPRFGIAWPYALAATAASLKWLLLIAWGLALAWALARR